MPSIADGIAGERYGAGLSGGPAGGAFFIPPHPWPSG